MPSSPSPTPAFFSDPSLTPPPSGRVLHAACRVVSGDRSPSTLTVSTLCFAGICCAWLGIGPAREGFTVPKRVTLAASTGLALSPGYVPSHLFSSPSSPPPFSPLIPFSPSLLSSSSLPSFPPCLLLITLSFSSRPTVVPGHCSGHSSSRVGPPLFQAVLSVPVGVQGHPL